MTPKARIRQIALVVTAIATPSLLATLTGAVALPGWAQVALGCLTAVSAYLAKSPLME